MSNQPRPLVSVIIPTYNQATFLPETLRSIQAQTFSNLEIILVDDGSTDATAEICQRFAAQDSRIHYILQENKGPSAARNRAIAAAKGDYVCPFDSDDLMEKEKVELQLAEFLKDPTIDVVYTAMRFINNEGELIGEMHSQEYPRKDFLVHLFFRNLVPCPSVVMARKACLITHPYNEKLRYAEDYELNLRLAHTYRFKYLDLPLTRYRRHAGNVSNELNQHRKMELEIVQQYRDEHIEEVIADSGLSESDKILMKGKIYFNIERFQTAKAVFELLSSALAHFYLGNCCVKVGQYGEAQKYYQHSLELDPSNPACYNNLGAVYMLSNENEKARYCFQQALALKPGYLDPSDNLQLISTQDHQTPKITFKELRPSLVPYQR